MTIVICDGCGRRIAIDDTRAARGLTLPDDCAKVDWCGDCVAIVRTELPRLAGQAREARRAAANLPVRERALRLWPPKVGMHTSAEITVGPR